MTFLARASEKWHPQSNAPSVSNPARHKNSHAGRVVAHSKPESFTLKMEENVYFYKTFTITTTIITNDIIITLYRCKESTISMFTRLMHTQG